MLFLAFSFSISTFSLSQPLVPPSDFRRYPPSSCGKVLRIDYPFWSETSRHPYCDRHGFQLNCPQDLYDYPSIEIVSQTFTVTEIDLLNHMMTLLPADFAYDNCSSHLTNTTVSIPLNIFHYDELSVKNVTITAPMTF